MVSGRPPTPPLFYSCIAQKGENIKRLRRQTNAEFVIEDFVLGCDERVLSIVLHRDSPQHTKSSGGLALVAAFDCLCEFKHTDEYKTTVSGSGTTVVEAAEAAEAATATTGSDGDAHMTSSTVHIPHSHEDEEFDIRLLIDASRTF